MSFTDSLVQQIGMVQQTATMSKIKTQVAVKAQQVQKQTGAAVVEMMRQAGKTIDTGRGLAGSA